MNEVTFFALYSDGRKYGVLREGQETFLITVEGGRMRVPWQVGLAEFVRYGFDYEPPKGLRPCDWAENTRRLNAHLALFIVPQKPATGTGDSRLSPTTPQSETKVHLEERLPGESRLQQLQRSVGRKELEARGRRQREFQEQVSQALPDARQLAAAAEIRRLNNFHARQMRPRGGGGFVVEE